MQFDYPHQLGAEAASQRLHKLSAYLLNRHGIQVEWNGMRGSFDGKYMMVTIKGEMRIEDDRVHFDGKDPGRLWRKKAVKYLKEKLEIYLDPATPLAELPVNKV